MYNKMVIPPTDIAYLGGYPESYCVRLHRECERRNVDLYTFTKALIVEYLEGRLIEVLDKESLSVCLTDSDKTML